MFMYQPFSESPSVKLTPKIQEGLGLQTNQQFEFKYPAHVQYQFEEHVPQLGPRLVSTWLSQSRQSNDVHADASVDVVVLRKRRGSHLSVQD